jgi:hypothetical protein
VETIGFFLSGVVATLVATLLALRILWRPLGRMLAELCGGSARGDCWRILVALCAPLGAAAASTLPDLTLSSAAAVSDPDRLLGNTVLQCAWGLGGVLVSLLVLAAALVAFIRRLEACAWPVEAPPE